MPSENHRNVLLPTTPISYDLDIVARLGRGRILAGPADVECGLTRTQQFVMQHLYLAIYKLFIHSPTKVAGPKVYAVWWTPRTWRDSPKDRYLNDSLTQREDCVDVIRICADEIRDVSG